MPCGEWQRENQVHQYHHSRQRSSHPQPYEAFRHFESHSFVKLLVSLVHAIYRNFPVGQGLLLPGKARNPAERVPRAHPCPDLKSDLRKTRVVIYSHNQHARLLPPEPLVVNQPKCTQAERAGIVMKSSGMALRSHKSGCGKLYVVLAADCGRMRTHSQVTEQVNLRVADATQEQNLPAWVFEISTRWRASLHILLCLRLQYHSVAQAPAATAILWAVEFVTSQSCT